MAASMDAKNDSTQSEDHSKFFDELVPPDSFSDKKERIESFVKQHVNNKSKIVLITSGGTTVPLESRTVRFIDNFSIGTRGATSAEYFLEQGYAVLFLHRHRSLQPFSQRVDRDILDALSVDTTTEAEPVVKVQGSHMSHLVSVVEKYHKFKHMLCLVDFTTLTEYLLLLRASSLAVSQCGKWAMLYLAAAVSDFYIPPGQLPEHKIQSSEGSLHLTLEMTPKMLSPLVKDWAPSAFIISFKLETDPSLLIQKAKKALATYKHQMVIANILETRKKEVYLVTKQSEQHLLLSEDQLKSGQEIEQPLIERLASLHTELIQYNKMPS